VAKNLFGGTTAKNFAIQGHPPIHSFEYVMAGGGYVTSAQGATYIPKDNWRPNDPGLRDAAPRIYEVSNSDWEAAQRWVANLSSNIKFASGARGDKGLPSSEVSRWDACWKKWLLFSGKLAAAQKTLKDEAVAAKILAATNPADWPSRTLHRTAQGSLALMSTEQKRELDTLVNEAKGLYDRFRLLGLGHVAMPYAGELAALLRSLPGELSLVDMAKRLRDAERAGLRLLDPRTVWWTWRTAADVQSLRGAIADAEALATKIEEVAKTPAGQGTRDASTPVYQYFVRSIAKIYVAASDLYGIAEPGESSEARRPEGAVLSIAWLAAAAGAGYIGWKWLLDKTKTAEDTVLGYHPQEESEKPSWNSTTTD
jgi:hypothetical protein